VKDPMEKNNIVPTKNNDLDDDNDKEKAEDDDNDDDKKEIDFMVNNDGVILRVKEGRK
jgi:hypothetical protein